MTRTSGQQPGPVKMRWVNVDHPDKLKDKTLMKGVRRHVMIHHLANDGDTSSNKVRKPKKLRSRHPHSETKTSRCRDNRQNHTLASDSPDACWALPPRTAVLDTDDSTEVSSAFADATKHVAMSDFKIIEDSEMLENSMRTTDVPPSVITPADGGFPIVSSAHISNDNSLVQPPTGFLYRRTSARDLPFPVPNPGSTVNPFHSWPAFERLDTVKLKHSCSDYFGSAMLSKLWVPMLLKARHAFLSTICISAAHDDIMRDAHTSIQQQNPLVSSERFQVNSQVVQMLNVALQDPELCLANSTIIAVLQVLTSEIMDCNDSVMAIHQNGLHKIIKERHGLGHLDDTGQLASIITVNMFMISVMRETLPHRDFEHWASTAGLKPGEVLGNIPESPMYCHFHGFERVKASFAPEDPTLELLDDLRLMTYHFIFDILSRKSNNPSPVHRRPDQAVRDFSKQIFFCPPAAAHHFFHSHPQIPDRITANTYHTYEAVRLTGLIYARALVSREPLSTAATKLHVAGISQEESALHVRVRYHLQRTDLSSCWGDRAGVLFWITLVASAAANPTVYAKQARCALRYDQAEEEASRKWLAAVAVRCSIVLGFQHGHAVLETLKRLIGIERALALSERSTVSDSRVSTIDDNELRPGIAHPEETHAIGPSEPPFWLRRGNFQDFADEFRRTMQ